MTKLKVLDLFSGIGGFSLGLERTGGFETVAFCEIDPFCQKVLKKHWPDVPIYNDVRKLEDEYASPPPDLICGGYPCQGESLAGKRKGEGDDRWLWPAMFGVVQKYMPSWFIGENVDGHVSLGLSGVLSDLGRGLYSARTFVIPSVAVGARSERARAWTVAYAQRDGVQGWTKQAAERCFESFEEQLARLLQPCPWPSLSSARSCGDRYGVSGRVDSVRRNKAIGNSVTPFIPQILGHAILAAEATCL